MISGRYNMELLPPEIILGMVEQHMNMATAMQFMRTTKACFHPSLCVWPRTKTNLAWLGCIQ